MLIIAVILSRRNIDVVGINDLEQDGSNEEKISNIIKIQEFLLGTLKVSSLC